MEPGYTICLETSALVTSDIPLLVPLLRMLHYESPRIKLRIF